MMDRDPGKKSEENPRPDAHKPWAIKTGTRDTQLFTDTERLNTIRATAPRIESSNSNQTNVRQLTEMFYHQGADRFRKTHPHPFLLQTSYNDSLPISTETTLKTSRNDSKALDIFSSNVYMVRKLGDLFKDMITIGRASNNDIFIPTGQISKFHGYFTKRDNDWFLTDSQSTNGSFINNQRIDPQNPVRVNFEAEISFSTSLSFRFVGPGKLFGYLDFFHHRLSSQ